ncbi:pyruvate kinase [Lacticaseibacillus paracasei subsp. paracasei CNCM I-4649]|nr:pyruvate kinase [Lacticaseibacillus paracasei subsp. paracasei CNCM I-4649]
MQKGDILVVKTTDKDYLPAIEKQLPWLLKPVA